MRHPRQGAGRADPDDGLGRCRPVAPGDGLHASTLDAQLNRGSMSTWAKRSWWNVLQIETAELTGDSAGTRRSIAAFRYGQAGVSPKVYIQAALHADEVPGVLVIQHLLALLDRTEIKGEIIVVPIANPIGLAQWAFQRPIGRFEAESMANFNRHYPDLAAMAGDKVKAKLTSVLSDNLAIIRAGFRKALAKAEARSDLEQQRLTLLKWSCDADYVLDLHCDHEAVLHLYAAPARPKDTSLLARCIGAELALTSEVSGGHAFDEAHTAPWAKLKRRFGAKFPIPDVCFSTTIEYRGQLDADDNTAASDARNLLTFLAQIGAVAGVKAKPAFAEPPNFPLAGYVQGHAPVGGVIAWVARPGDWVKAGDVVCYVTEAMTRQRVAVAAPIDGMMFRRELWRACLRGQGLFHIAGSKPLRRGHLLSD